MERQIPLEVARRFVLGRSGLWPGRRWRAPEGTEAAIRAVAQLQLDPLVLVARAHDLILHARVLRAEQVDVAAVRHRALRARLRGATYR